MVHEAATLGIEAEEVRMAARRAKAPAQIEHVTVRFAEADDEMHADPPGPKNFAGFLEDRPVAAPPVWAVDAFAPRPFEDLRRAGIQGDGEDVGAERVQPLDVAARHRRWVRENRHWHLRAGNARRPAFENRRR